MLAARLAACTRPGLPAAEGRRLLRTVIGLEDDWQTWRDTPRLPAGGADLLPLLGDRVARTHAGATPTLGRLAAAMVVEERRADRIAEIAGQVLATLRATGATMPLIVDGPIPAAQGPALRLRHSARLVVLLADTPLPPLVEQLARTALIEATNVPPRAAVALLRHPSGMPIELWRGHAPHPFAALSHAALASHATADGFPAATDRLALLLAGAVRAGNPADLRWIADVHLLDPASGVGLNRWLIHPGCGYLLANALAVSRRALSLPDCDPSRSPRPSPVQALRDALALRGRRRAVATLLGRGPG